MKTALRIVGPGFCPAAELLLGVPGGGCDFKSARIADFSKGASMTLVAESSEKVAV